MDLLNELEWRGLLYDRTDGLRDALASGMVTGYIGFDPTADSLHVGSLLTVMGLARLQRAGHRPIAIVGGGTGMIGDPSGKTQERVLLSRDLVDANVAGLRRQLERFLDFSAAPNAALIVNNADWLAAFDLLGFLRDTGKHFTVNYMLQKESVSRRLESEEGISYTEFSYLLLQARDFVELFDRHGCTLQMGGSDQWGNITAGIDLVRKLRQARAHGLVWPLMTTSSGTKFGKTEAGTIWLDPKRTSPFHFYQFWLNVDDRDAIPYLKFFTFLTREQIDALAQQTTTAPEHREAQRTLAREVTTLVHGADQVARAERAAAVLFGEGLSHANVEDVLMVFADAPSTELALPADGMALVEMLAAVRLAASRSEATRLVKSGGVYVNNVRAADERARITRSEAIGGELILLRKGRRDQHLVRIRKS
ncbi:MAG TPA: tyrosine--tRNA ligase [Vicinamibacterales bacterium]|jgi:tyrosyl-tRNA synthetase|nr:tyrosine--tRNA ligase [Vicinamibacterales bacterium]